MQPATIQTIKAMQDLSQQVLDDLNAAQANPPAAEEELTDSFLSKHRGSVVCLGTDGILGGLLAWLGHGFPDQGDRMDSSGSMFDGVIAQIAALGPDGGWQGSAARAYGARNLAQSQHTGLMADLDRLAAELVSAQADDVHKVRSTLWALVAIVSVLLVVCIGLELQGPEGQLVSFYSALPICGTALFVAAVALTFLAVTTSRNASAVQAATQRLTAMVAALTTGSDAVPGSPEMPTPPKYSLSEFGLAEDTGPTPPQLPDLQSTLAELPGAPEFHLATGAGVGFPDFGAPQLPITALTGLPTLPTIAQLSTTLSQLTNLAGPSSATTQPAQQHTTAADHLTQDDATNTPDTATAATTTSGERAPLGSTTRPTQQHQNVVV
ncbi:EspA/EspE family type VII secretion system effector [Mycobacterium marinum]|uniref:EspA/EspE family type VII secretion system effector n=1 Tax=Mycobacterium marinum TaxID=1781 RepID=UPI00235948A2|nr:EspA/EspE family type VII secretion system effector [Mycobacterium marinum]MDC9006971.1 EspA/EspE family type VII secretion system effector [Mycobacterium marinum]